MGCSPTFFDYFTPSGNKTELFGELKRAASSLTQIDNNTVTNMTHNDDFNVHPNSRKRTLFIGQKFTHFVFTSIIYQVITAPSSSSNIFKPGQTRIIDG